MGFFSKKIWKNEKKYFTRKIIFKISGNWQKSVSNFIISSHVSFSNILGVGFVVVKGLEVQFSNNIPTTACLESNTNVAHQRTSPKGLIDADDCHIGTAVHHTFFINIDSNFFLMALEKVADSTPSLNVLWVATSFFQKHTVDNAVLNVRHLVIDLNIAANYGLWVFLSNEWGALGGDENVSVGHSSGLLLLRQSGENRSQFCS